MSTEEATVKTEDDKQVHFQEPTTTDNKKQQVLSRRGRYLSPGRRQSPVIEYKTFRSRNSEEVPSLCSANSGPMSPPQPEKATADVKSPTRDQSELPKMDDKLVSPGGMFLEPSTPSKRSLSFEEKKEGEEEDTKPSPRPSPRRDRDHFVATPTDFALDYGKSPMVSASFDTSNVLAWLQSPNANELFSPGNSSIANTPHAPPRTPTVSTSFFFSDVASLQGDSTTTPTKRKGNIICISPLSSSKKSAAPLNFKEVFASPRTKISSLPMLNDTPSRKELPKRGSSKDPSVDAVHLAERDLMEDEDLSVLLQLANNTPRSAERKRGPVFRAARKPGNDALQLPMIGRDDEDAKKAKEDGIVGPPQLGMRSTSGSASNFKPDAKGDAKTSETSSSQQPPYPMHPPYPPHHRPDAPYYHHHGPLPPGMPKGPIGSMRVTVGGPPPPNRPGAKGSPSRPGTSPHPPPPHYPDYPPPNGMYPPPPPGMYASYPGPYGGYPYPNQYPGIPPPPRHMPMYNAQHGANKSGGSKKPRSTPSKTTGGGKPGSKRPAPTTTVAKSPAATKKARKVSPGSSGKRKPRTSPLSDKGERQRTADQIQAVNAANGSKNDKAASLAAAILRGVTMRPSGKWQAQLYFAGKSRYIGVFDSREKAALAYEIAREKLKSGPPDGGPLNPQSTDALVNEARKAAFEGVNAG